MNPSIDLIKRHVAAFFEVSVSQLVGQRRGRAIARPRQVAMYLSSRLTNNSYPVIGAKFGGRDHSTVMHAVKAIEGLIDSDPDFAATVERVRATLPTILESGYVVEADDLDTAARKAIQAVVQRAKYDPAASASGHPETLRGALLDGFGERPTASGVSRDGVRTELLVSERGTWSIIVVSDADDHAHLIACGDQWTAAPAPIKQAAPAPVKQAEVTPPRWPRKDNCLRCEKSFIRTSAGHRHCGGCRTYLKDAGNSLGAV